VKVPAISPTNSIPFPPSIKLQPRLLKVTIHHLHIRSFLRMSTIPTQPTQEDTPEKQQHDRKERKTSKPLHALLLALSIDFRAAERHAAVLSAT